jgi:hypothetical protein
VEDTGDGDRECVDSDQWAVAAVDVNRAPSAQNDAYTAPTGVTLDVPAPGVLGNDSDPDGDTLSVSVLAGPSHGSLSLSSNGSFRYTPETGHIGADAFTYTLSDGRGGTATATVTLDVIQTNRLSRRPADEPPDHRHRESPGEELPVQSPPVLTGRGEGEADGAQGGEGRGVYEVGADVDRGNERGRIAQELPRTPGAHRGLDR